MSMKVLLQLQTKEFQKGLRGIQRQLNGFKNFMKSAFALGSITMFGKQLVTVGKDFENAMARVQAVSNATTEEFKKMQAEAQRLGSTTRYTATEAAEALENLTRNGMTAANATKALSSVLQLAQANSIQLADAANIVTNTLNMFNLSVEQTGRVNDVLSSTASHAATDITNLYEAMVNAAPAANVLGFSIEEVSSAIGALAQSGVKGSEAGTKLRIAFQKMADPKVIDKMHQYGIEVDENTMRTEGLRKTVEKISKANLSLGQLGKIFDAKSAMAIQQLVAGLEDLDYMLGVTANSAGETERMFNQSVGTVQKELDSLKSMYEGLLITISQKTGGVVKGAIKLLQNLISNFETVGGTIANIASVAVPLLTKRVITLGRSLSTMFSQAAAGAATLKVAMGGIVTIVATLVTWIGTALYGAWRRSTEAIRDANKALADAEKESIKTQRAIDGLKKEIGSGDNQNSVNGALAKAIKLFPEFEDAIRSAAAEASRTGNWEKLKKVLQDIADLQSLIAKADAREQVQKANAKKIGSELYKSTQFKGGQWWNPFYTEQDNAQPYQRVSKLIKKELESKNLSKEAIQDIFNEIGDIMTSNLSSVEDEIEAIKNELELRGVKIDDNQIKELVSGIRTSSKTNEPRMVGNEAAGYSTGYSNLAAEKQFDTAKDTWDAESANLKESLRKREISEKEFHKKMEDAALKFMNKVYSIENLPQSHVQTAIEATKGYYPPTMEKNLPEPGGNGSGTPSGKTDIEKVKDAIDDYNEEVTKLNNRLSAGTIAQKDYEKELGNLEDKTWETITAFTNFKDLLNELKQSALGAKLESGYGERRTKEGASEIAKQLGELGKYNLKEKARDTTYDYMKSKSDIATEEVEVKFDYAESLNKLATDLQAAIESGQFDLVKEDAVDELNRLRNAAIEASNAAETLKDKLNLSNVVAELDEQIKSLSQSSFETFTGLAEALDRVNSSLFTIAQIFDEDLKDSPLFEAYEAFSSTLNASIQVMSTVATVLEMISKLEQKKAKEKIKNTAEEVLANELATKSELKRSAAEAGAAVAGGASSVASIPYVGPALAVAAAAAIATAIAAAMAKFENGGIVGGNSYSGDKNVIRANSGEMVLTKGQQTTLFNAIKSGNLGGGGNVQFKIRGTDLIGVINNEQSRRRG